MPKHIHVHFHDSWNESQHPRANNGEFGAGAHGPDTAMVNLPLDKRGGGSINAQLDRYKAEQVAKAKSEAKTASGARKTDKAQAKASFAEHGAAMIEKYSKSMNKTPKDIREVLDQMAKWEPKQFNSFVDKYLKEKGNAAA